MSDALMDIKFTPVEALELEKSGFTLVDSLPPSAMSEVLRKEIIRICSDGDKSKNFSIAVIAHLERFILAAKEILIAEKVASNDLEGLLKGRRKRFGGNVLGGQIPAMLGDGYEDDFQGAFMGNGGMGAENFGGQAIRQLVDAATKMHESPAKLVEALAAAKEHGLTDVVKVLEAKLGVVPQPQLEASPAPEGEAK